MAEIGPLIWTRTDSFPSGGAICRQEEKHYLVQVPESFRLEPSGPDPNEPFADARWWTIEELERAEGDIFPRRLPTLLRTLLTDGPPLVPLDAGV